MRIVTVARKPCAASSTTENVVEHQAGALNIDASRVSYVSREDRREETRGVHVGGAYEHPAGSSFKKAHNPVAPAHEDGRWPTNVLLVHRPGCKIVGERKVPTGTAVRHRGGGKTIFSETDKPPLEDMSYADVDGNETIPQWACEESCPVADLDRQSGKRKSGSGAVKRSSGADQAGNQGAAYGRESRPAGTPQIWYGDEGGASRFFKQFKPDGS